MAGVVRVAGREPRELGEQVLLARRGGDGERALQPVLLRHAGEQRFQAADADRFEHLLDVGLGMRDVAQGRLRDPDRI